MRRGGGGGRRRGPPGRVPIRAQELRRDRRVAAFFPFERRRWRPSTVPGPIPERLGILRDRIRRVPRPWRRVHDVRGGVQAQVQLGILRAVVLAARPLGQRGPPGGPGGLPRLLEPHNDAVVETGHGRFLVPLGDGYAVKLLDPTYHYEPELEPYFAAAMRAGCAFLDGGANLGYWSVVASDEGDEPGRVVAVEPVPAIFDRLRENARLTADRFVCQQAALWSEPDVDLTIASHPQWHAGSRVLHGPRAAAEGQYTTRVPTTTIDQVARRHWPNERPLLIKLDVEGAESAALAGGEDTLANRDVVLIYEDHGSDPEHTSTRAVLEGLGFRVYACTSKGPVEIRGLGDVARIKTDTVHAFNSPPSPPRGGVGPAVRAATP